MQRTGINTDKVKQALDQAAPYMDQATSKDAAVGILQRLGVDSGTIHKARKLLDNPLAPVIANMAGVDLNAIKRGVDELSGTNTTTPQQLPPPVTQQRSASQASANLADLKAALGRIKK